jgi:hypothetical protein
MKNYVCIVCLYLIVVNSCGCVYVNMWLGMCVCVCVRYRYVSFCSQRSDGSVHGRSMYFCLLIIHYLIELLSAGPRCTRVVAADCTSDNSIYNTNNGSSNTDPKTLPSRRSGNHIVSKTTSTSSDDPTASASLTGSLERVSVWCRGMFLRQFWRLFDFALSLLLARSNFLSSFL